MWAYCYSQYSNKNNVQCEIDSRFDTGFFIGGL
jgi:hypothetical protein